FRIPRATTSGSSTPPPSTASQRSISRAPASWWCKARRRCSRRARSGVSLARSRTRGCAPIPTTCTCRRSASGASCSPGYGGTKRLPAFPTPERPARVPLVIVGGGIAGLSAAWRLDKRGFRDFVIVEMEQRAGGNARWGENEVTAYPWGAHYVPVPGRWAVLVRELFEE